MKSFLQTKEWLDFQKHLGRATWRFDNGRISANVVAHKLPLGKNYLYIPHGPVLNFDKLDSGIRNEVDNFLAYVKNLGKENKSIFIKFEPTSDSVMELLFRKRMKKADSIQPQRTVVLNLDLSEEELLSRMHHKTRYNINLASRKNLIFKEADDVEVFWKLLKKTAKKDRFQTHGKDYYFELYDFFKNGGNLRTNLFVVEHESAATPTSEVGAPTESVGVAAALVMFYEDTAYYLHGAMDRNYKELMAPYFMHWEVVKWAKNFGYHCYDLWGIDARRWPGVTRFKLGWGGEVKEYPGSFDLVISKFWYLIYKISRKIF